MTSDAFTQKTLEVPFLRHPFPVESAPTQESPIADKVRAGLKLARIGLRKAVSVGTAVGSAVAEVGRWVGRHKVGVSYAVGAIAAGVAIFNAVEGFDSLHYYDTFTTAANTLLDLEGTTAPVLPESSDAHFVNGGIAAGVCLGSTLVGMTLGAEGKGDSGLSPQLRQKVAERLAPRPTVPATQEYVPPEGRLYWLDENEVRTDEHTWTNGPWEIDFAVGPGNHQA